jgi:hypothetical protein
LKPFPYTFPLAPERATRAVDSAYSLMDFWHTDSKKHTDPTRVQRMARSFSTLVHPGMTQPLSAGDLFQRHIGPLMLSTGFIGLFIIGVPIIKIFAGSPEAESILFALLFLFCHVANWPMLQLRWTLWAKGHLTPYATWCLTALLFGSFGIPLVLLADLLG